MEGQPMVSYSAGSMNSLVNKLTKLKNMPPEVGQLKQDLVNLEKNFFHKVVRQQEMNLHVEVWMKHVRELVFDMEDWVDQNMDMGDLQLEIEEEVPQFKARIKHLCELCERYDLFIGVPTDHLHIPAIIPSRGTVDSRILFGEKTVRVRGRNPTVQLLKLLTGKNEKMLRVVSIVGMEGLGKTTLAKEIYAKLQLEGKFDCWASVSVGKRPSMRITLMEIFGQVMLCEKEPNHMYAREASMDLRTLVSELRQYLSVKRYFIFVDGLWSTRAWKVINCALPDKNCGSRVLTTTSMMDVAKCCSVFPTDVYHMEALNEKMSTNLYFETIGQREWSADCDEATKNMLKMCGGMPLAIKLAAGLLSTESEQVPEPKILRRTALSSVEQNSRPEGMMELLQMSYAALSLPLQSCLLYLSVFRENYTIKKDRLVRLWIAEGFIPREDKEKRGEEERVEETTGCEEGTRGEESSWETGERYFNELIMRRLIQPVFNDNEDQAVGCTVHSAILDFIKSLSTKVNFVTIGGAHLRTYSVRRFSLDCYGDQGEDGDGTLASIAAHLSRVRSVTVLGDMERMDGRSALTRCGNIEGDSVLPCFKLIRVLDLQGSASVRSHHLEGIGGLVLLKYLGVARTDIDKLPEEIGELEQLETLDLRHTKLSILPESIVKQKRLAHLLIDHTVKLPNGIQKMQGLEEVSTIGVDSESSVVELLRKLLERLRILGVRLNRGTSYGELLHIDFSSYTKLTSLSLYYPCEHLLSYQFCPPHVQLRRFELKISTPVLAAELSLISLFSVTHLEVEIVDLDQEVFCLLGRLPKLVLLKLVSTCQHEGLRRHTVDVGGGFHCLKVFSFTYHSGGAKLQFSSSAMKELRRLSLEFDASDALHNENFWSGINHLSSLTRVRFTIDCKLAPALAAKHVEDEIRSQLGKLCRDVTIEFTTTGLNDKIN